MVDEDVKGSENEGEIMDERLFHLKEDLPFIFLLFHLYIRSLPS
jgi:hypothetical protein